MSKGSVLGNFPFYIFLAPNETEVIHETLVDLGDPEASQYLKDFLEVLLLGVSVSQSVCLSICLSVCFCLSLTLSF